jgi:hypothetical protein
MELQESSVAIEAPRGFVLGWSIAKAEALGYLKANARITAGSLQE